MLTVTEYAALSEQQIRFLVQAPERFVSSQVSMLLGVLSIMEIN